MTSTVVEPGRRTPVYGEVDVVVVGGGPAGLMAAAAALAPDSAVVKRAVAGDGVRRFSGPAKVFGSREAALDGIRAAGIRAGQVVVLTGLGLRGAPPAWGSPPRSCSPSTVPVSADRSLW
jgi:hypothetical protein